MADVQKLVAIIPAAGTSQRLRPPGGGGSARISSKTPKQYATVCNKPLIYHTVAAFLSIRCVGHIVVLAAPDSVCRTEEILAPAAKHYPTKRLECIAGGTSRHRSIKQGLDHLAGTAPDLVIIHDGARPLLDEAVLQQLIEQCRKHGAAGCVRPLTSTVVRPVPDSMVLDEVLNRSSLLASETPQVFRYTALAEAYARCTEQDLDHGTECLDLVWRYGQIPDPPALVPVDAGFHFKVTYTKDLYAADCMLKERRNILIHCHFGFGEKENTAPHYAFIKYLKDDLGANFFTVKYFSEAKPGPSSNSSGTVHVVFHFGPRYDDVLEQNLAMSYENLVYLFVQTGGQELIDDADSTVRLIRWARSITKKNKEVKHFYLVATHAKRLTEDDSGYRTRETIVYLCKELPGQLTGQTFLV